MTKTDVPHANRVNINLYQPQKSSLYKKDEPNENFEDLDKFKSFQREPETHEQLIKATVSETDCERITHKIKSVFSNKNEKLIIQV